MFIGNLFNPDGAQDGRTTLLVDEPSTPGHADDLGQNQGVPLSVSPLGWAFVRGYAYTRTTEDNEQKPVLDFNIYIYLYMYMHIYTIHMPVCIKWRGLYIYIRMI